MGAKKMENFIELKNKVLLAGLQRVYNTDKIFGNQCAAFFFAGFFFPLSMLFFILASFQPGSSYHPLPGHTLLLGHWSTPSCGRWGRWFWAPGWSHKSGQHLLLQWLGQPRRSEIQDQVIASGISAFEDPLRILTMKFTAYPPECFLNHMA